MFLLASLFLLLQTSSAQTCRAIALEGGGSHGAYEAGVMWALANLTNAGNVQWNVVSGISAGALNTFGVAQFPMGKEVEMSNFVVNLWLTLNGSEAVYKQWPGGYVQGLLFEGGIYDYSPMKKTLEKNFLHGINRNFSVGSTNLDTGLFSTFNESVGSNIVSAVLASASPPFFFPPTQFQGIPWADGGCIINLDVFSAIERCLEITTQSNIVLDTVFDSEYSPLPNETNFKTPEVLARSFGIRSYDSSIWYLYNAFSAYPAVNYRYIIHPSEPFPGGIVPLNFSQSVLEYEVQVGINDTKAALGSGVDGKVIIQELYKAYKANIIYP